MNLERGRVSNSGRKAIKKQKYFSLCTTNTYNLKWPWKFNKGE